MSADVSGPMPRLRTRAPSTQLAKLDRLGWVAGMCVDAYGVRVGVRVNARPLLPLLASRLPPGSRPAASPLVDQLYSVWLAGRPHRPGRVHLLYAGAEHRARTRSRQGLVEAFETSVRLEVASSARRYVFVHAGVVGWRGRAIVLPGRSGSGKTTLVAELLRAGATYYSDEFAVIDGRGRVHPFASPLSIREGEETCRRSAQDLGGGTGTAPLPVALVAFATYRASGRWRPVVLSPAQALLALIPHAVPVRRRPRAALAALLRAVGGARLVRAQRGEAADATAWLLGHAGETTRGAA